MIKAHADSLATAQDLREEVAMMAETIETRDVNITNHSAKTIELCQVTLAKCNETIAAIELTVKNLGAQVDTKGIVQGVQNALEGGIHREIITPLLRRTRELTGEIVPALQKVREASAEASKSWRQRLWLAAICHGVMAGVAIAFAAGAIIYYQFSDYYERKTAAQITYAERLVNYNQEAFRQLAVAQMPIKVLRTETDGVINQGFALEVPDADSAELRPEGGHTNGYILFTSGLLEKQIQTLLRKTEKPVSATNTPAK
jgi:hypothetical protein